MTEKKRPPPWERARLNFTLKERERLRLVEAKDRPAREALLVLQDNKRRLAEIKKNICQNCEHYILNDELTEGEKKVGQRYGFCQCKNPSDATFIKS